MLRVGNGLVRSFFGLLYVKSHEIIRFAAPRECRSGPFMSKLQLSLCLTGVRLCAIGASHTACKDELGRNIRSHSCGVFLFLYCMRLWLRSDI